MEQDGPRQVLRLSLGRLGVLADAARPVPDPREVTVGIVHLGIGAFHRAHQAVYTQRALMLGGDVSWGICGVTQRSAEVADAMCPQDCLYTVAERSGQGSVVRVIGAVREVLVRPDQPEDVVARLSSPDTKVVSLAVSEKGYRQNPATGALWAEDPEVVADAAGRPP